MEVWKSENEVRLFFFFFFFGLKTPEVNHEHFEKRTVRSFRSRCVRIRCRSKMKLLSKSSKSTWYNWVLFQILAKLQYYIVSPGGSLVRARGLTLGHEYLYPKF